VSDAEFGADGLARLHRHPTVVEHLHAAPFSDHDADVADVLALGPVARFVHEVGVFLVLFHGGLEGPLRPAVLAPDFAADPTQADHVRLTHEDEDLERLGGVGRLGRVGGSGGGVQGGDAEGQRCEESEEFHHCPFGHCL
jgi:hypothetical protein